MHSISQCGFMGKVNNCFRCSADTTDHAVPKTRTNYQDKVFSVTPAECSKQNTLEHPAEYLLRLTGGTTT